MGLFGSKPAPHPGQAASPPPPARKGLSLSSVDKARLDIKKQRDRLSKADLRTLFEAKALEDLARKALRAKDTPAAMHFVKLQRLKEIRHEQVNKAIINLEGLLGAIDAAEEAGAVASALEAGTRALQQLSDDMPLERAERIMEDAQEAMDVGAEIDAALNRALEVPGGAAFDPAAAQSEAARQVAALLAQAEGVGGMGMGLGVGGVGMGAGAGALEPPPALGPIPISAAAEAGAGAGRTRSGSVSSSRVAVGV